MLQYPLRPSVRTGAPLPKGEAKGCAINYNLPIYSAILNVNNLLPPLQLPEVRDKLGGYDRLLAKEMRIKMKECKYCNVPMEDSHNFCPNCGKPWTEEVCEEPAEAPAGEVTVPEVLPGDELPETGKKNSAKIAAAVIAVVLVAALLISLIAMGVGSKEDVVPAETAEAAETTDAAEPTELMATEATIPADGNPEDVTCKGSYTADDETVIAAADTVVATLGDAQLTVSQLNVYYWLEVTNFLNTLYSYYGVDASYYGMDYTLGLDYQLCGIADGVTWQQFFLESALGSWQNYQTLTMEAEMNGYQLEEEYASDLENLKANLDIQAQSYGLADAEELLAMNVGNGADLEDYYFFLRNNYVGGGYLDSLVNQLNPTDAEVEAYFTENEEAYNANGLTRDMKSVDVRHILVFPEGADTSTIYTEEFSEEAWAAGEAKANEIYEAYLAGDLTEESFAALANEHSADSGSNTNGGLYTGVMQGDMVAEFDAWCFDESRQVGDTAVVRTDLGFHVMYFSGSQVMYPDYAREDMKVEYQQELLEEAVAKYEIRIDYSAIVLGYLDLMG